MIITVALKSPRTAYFEPTPCLCVCGTVTIYRAVTLPNMFPRDAALQGSADAHGLRCATSQGLASPAPLHSSQDTTALSRCTTPYACLLERTRLSLSQSQSQASIDARGDNLQPLCKAHSDRQAARGAFGCSQPISYLYEVYVENADSAFVSTDLFS
ncbi:hypothetical protein CC79DRAFT_195273 [Sarocladium strictum]